MVVAIIDFCAGNNDYVAAALVSFGMKTFVADGAADAAAAEIVLLLAGDIGAGPLGFIAEFRALHPATPLMVLAERDDVEARLAAYEAGADDCLSKPFHLRELVAKLRATARRAAQGATLSLLAHARTTIDPAALELRVADRVRRLTKREADLLVSLGRAGGRVVRREDVIRDAWGAPAGVTGNLVDVYVGYARRKLSQLSADVAIKSVRGEGFRLAYRSDHASRT